MLLFRSSFRGCLRRGAGSSTPKGGRQGVLSQARSRPDWGDVSGGLPVSVLNIILFRSSSRRPD
eukprot:7898200-Pyramimonas_sp.AAC.1